MKRRHRFAELLGSGFRLVNHVMPWYRLPRLVGIWNLVTLRHDLRRWNLFDTRALLSGRVYPACPFHKKDLQQRREDGAHNDLQDSSMGRAGTPFGRNAPFETISASPEPGLERPSPRTISRQLMTRTHFLPATSLNLLAAAWIQFQIHDWFGHQEADQPDAPIALAEDDEWHECPMKVRRTRRVEGGTTGCPAQVPVFLNTETHWWDGSQLYGSSAKRQREIRSGDKGQLTVHQGRLPSMGKLDPKLSGIDLTGFNDNYWIGLSVFHTVFALEHNAICHALAAEYPSWTDDELFQKARLINAALLAKIHTVEWTPALLQHPTLETGMKANWWGLLGEELRKRVGRLNDSEVWSGIPGSSTNHHGVPYAITEEFVAVYRLHPLIPDEYRFCSLTDPTLNHYRSFPDLEGNNTRRIIDEVGIENVWFSFGVAHPGQLRLGNFPRFLQQFRRIKPLPNGDDEILDVASLDIFRDRERGVPRYNAFRRMLRMKPINSFEELNQEWAKTLKDLYGNDIERMDLMVGLYAEEPPPGFAISDTAFRIFTLMAPRRLKSDRFFTADFRPEVYTPLGMDWVQNNNLTDVLLRHYPALAPALHGLGNAFLPWRNVHASPL